MPIKTDPNLTQREGAWEELMRDSTAFAGKRVRVTILPDLPAGDASFMQAVHQWLAEGEALSAAPSVCKTDAFTEALVEKARKQGLVI